MAFLVLRSGAPRRDLPETYGPRTTSYNRFVRWRQAGVWDRIMDALAARHDAAVQDDPYLRRASAPAWSLRRRQRTTRYGSLARGPDKQDSASGRR